MSMLRLLAAPMTGAPGLAFSSLQAALEVAEADDEIWVAAGIYRPGALSDPSDPRTATFQLSEQLAIYGGFAGSETSRAERDWRTNQVILKRLPKAIMPSPT